MELSERELIDHVSFRDRKKKVELERHPDKAIEDQLSLIRWRIWSVVSGQMLDGDWDSNAYIAWIEGKSDEEVLGMIARVKMENDL